MNGNAMNGNTANESIFERDAIEQVQRYLRQLSYHDEGINPVPIDGIWDSETRRALIAFQKQQGLAPTGTVDRATFELLKREYDRSVALNSPPAKVDLFPRQPQGYAVTVGASGALVDVIQYILDELEALYNFPDYTPSGEYDEQTALLVRDFQRRNGIAVSGNVDRETWDALAVQHNLYFAYPQ